MNDPITTYARTTTIEMIVAAVSLNVAISIDQMRGLSRVVPVCRARQVAMYLAYRFTRSNVEEIGDYFGLGHATVLHALKKIQRDIDDNEAFARLIDHIAWPFDFDVLFPKDEDDDEDEAWMVYQQWEDE